MILSAPLYALKARAKREARARSIPLSQALDTIAAAEGFQSWSHLAAADAAKDPTGALLERLSPAALILLAARPGQGKTMLGLDLLLHASRAGRDTQFFTLEYTADQVTTRLRDLAPDADMSAIAIDTSDRLSADHIAAGLSDMRPNGVVVIDYLQLLDQRRDTPTLAEQLTTLRAVAQRQSLSLICLSQVDRAFDDAGKALPDATDLRLPNPVDLSVFDQMIFMGEGAVRLRTAA